MSFISLKASGFVKNLSVWLSVWFFYAKLSVMSWLEYRASIAISVFATAVFAMATPITFYVIYSNGVSVGGWSFYELCLLAGFFSVSLGFVDLFFYNLMNLPRHVRKGTLDYFLTKPLNVLFHVSIRNVDETGIGSLLSGVFLLALGFNGIPAPSLVNALAGLVLFAFATLSLYSLFLILVSLSFWFVEVEVLLWDVREVTRFGQYPISIFPGILGTFLSFIVPVGLASFYPASAFLGRNLGVFAFIVPVYSIALFLFARWFFYKGLAKYSSAGG